MRDGTQHILGPSIIVIYCCDATLMIRTREHMILLQLRFKNSNKWGALIANIYFKHQNQ